MTGSKSNNLIASTPTQSGVAVPPAREDRTSQLQNLGGISEEIAIALQIVIANSSSQQNSSEGGDGKAYEFLRDQQKLARQQADRDRQQVDRDRTDYQHRFNGLTSKLNNVDRHVHKVELNNVKLGARLNTLGKSYKTLSDNHDTARKDFNKLLFAACGIIVAMVLALGEVLIKPETSWLINFFQYLGK